MTHAAIVTRIDRKRGCGFRKPGGLYLCSDGAGRECGKTKSRPLFDTEVAR
jgi:hypothetical protein